jgi:hypothetical protein
LRLKVTQNALDEELDRGKRQADARSLHRRLRFDVNQEILEQLIGSVDIGRLRLVTKLLDNVGDKRIALTDAHRIVDRPDHGEPV